MTRYGTIPGRYEVSGTSILSVVDATGVYSGVTRKIFARYGLKDLQRDGWYPMPNFLDAFVDVAGQVGDATLLAIGKKIPENALWPPGVTDISSAIFSIDIAYHMNHHLDGVNMFDPATNTILDGIGHYRCEHVGKRKIVATSDTPYPCEFDRGIYLGIGRRFEPSVEVELIDVEKSRRRGGEVSTYVLTW